MSRAGWDDDRDVGETTDVGREVGGDGGHRALETPERDVRQPVRGARGRDYQLRESEWRTLETIGTFRVVAATDVVGLARDEAGTRADLRHLADVRLVQQKTAIVDHKPTRLVVLTRDGKSLLEQHRSARDEHEKQQYYAGFVKPRELAHDAQLYRAYKAERSRLEAEGGRVTRVVLDYELKRDYQAFLNRSDRPEGATLQADRAAFAEAYGLPIVDDHLELPDLRLEVELADGSHDVRDVEVVTAHYSRSQLAGKVKAGFSLYRAGGGTTRGGTPYDPRGLEWLR
jgi:hypothetical protein